MEEDTLVAENSLMDCDMDCEMRDETASSVHQSVSVLEVNC